jgi:hypothetical protein
MALPSRVAAYLQHTCAKSHCRRRTASPCHAKTSHCPFPSSKRSTHKDSAQDAVSPLPASKSQHLASSTTTTRSPGTASDVLSISCMLSTNHNKEALYVPMRSSKGVMPAHQSYTSAVMYDQVPSPGNNPARTAGTHNTMQLLHALILLAHSHACMHAMPSPSLCLTCIHCCANPRLHKEQC